MVTQLTYTTGKETNTQTLFVQVLVPVPVWNDFTYRVPEALNESVLTGKRVSIPFGKNRILTGIVTEVHSRVPKEYTAKYVLDVLDAEPVVDQTHLQFWQWMASYYMCTPGEVMEAALPASMMLGSETRILLHPSFEINDDVQQLTPNETVVIEVVKKQQEVTLNELSKLTAKKNLMPVIKRLVEKECLIVRKEILEGYKPLFADAVTLNPDLDDASHLKEIFAELERAPKQSDMLLSLLELRKKQEYVTKKELLDKTGASDAVFKGLKDKGIIHVEKVKQQRLLPYSGIKKDAEKLTDAQAEALESIKSSFEEKPVTLLHGITGSGKTHIYIEWMRELINKDKQVLYLVPEIGLSSQLIRRLQVYFGDQIGIYHSRFNNQERYEIWEKVRDKTYKIVLGVRSAMFLPFKDLGGVIIDEEHETSFRQHDPAPRYHARDASIYLATCIFDGRVLMGSATPSFESYFNALSGKFGLVDLSERYLDMRMPAIHLADMKQPYKEKKMRSHLTPALYSEIEKTLANKRQVVLFQNRRGYAPLLECSICGWSPYCDNCDISLTYHQILQKVICHYCGYKTPVPSHCRHCGHAGLTMKSFGTEKIEDELPYFFPDAGVIRLDQDTTRGRETFDQFIRQFEQGEKHIMVGTQMITKGLDFENLYLVGILHADQLLHYPDFRARERAFQLMLQVGGRAGRKKEQGKVIIQTFSPGHPLFSYLQVYDYKGFFESEIMQRKQFHYPPYCKLIKLTFKHPDRKLVQEAALSMGNNLRKIFGKHLLGPEFPPVARIKNQYINEIMIKLPNKTSKLKDAKQRIRDESDKLKNHRRFRKVHLIAEADPY